LFCRTANLDAFEEEAVTFTNAFTPVALCGPSRASFLTGIYPWTIGYYIHHKINPRREQPYVYQANIVKYFESMDYDTYGVGKVFHAQDSSTKSFGRTSFVNTAQDKCGSDTDIQATCSIANEETLSDNKALDLAKRRLNMYSKAPNSRWFMVVGLRRPHLPEAIPHTILKALDIDNFNLSTPFRVFENTVPARAPKYARSITCQTLFQYMDFSIDNGILDSTSADLFRRFYYAGVSYIDDIIGQLLISLTDKGFKDNTLVVMMSDHGYSLGEHGAWCKRSVYDQTTKTSLWIRDPGTAPRKEDSVVSLVDLTSTIAELAGVPMNPDYVGESDGRSFAHLVQQRSQTSSELSIMENKPRLKGYFFPYYSAFSVNPVCEKNGEILECEDDIKVYDYMAYSFRTSRYRYAEYRLWIPSLQNGNWSAGGKLAAELYDVKNDPGEMINVLDSFQNAPLLNAMIEGLRAEFVQCSSLNNLECSVESHCTVLRGQECIAKIECSRYTSYECPNDYCQMQNGWCKTIAASRLPAALQPILGQYPLTNSPTNTPTNNPVSISPTSNPVTNDPTKAPTPYPVTMVPTSSSPSTSFPTKLPTFGSTRHPTQAPLTSLPSASPVFSKAPSIVSDRFLTGFPTVRPTTDYPTRSPITIRPSKSPTRYPTHRPTFKVTSRPSKSPTRYPTRRPTFKVTSRPSKSPTSYPTRRPTFKVTSRPSKSPTSYPTRKPMLQPTFRPSKTPTLFPTRRPISTKAPTGFPSQRPTTPRPSKPSIN